LSFHFPSHLSFFHYHTAASSPSPPPPLQTPIMAVGYAFNLCLSTLSYAFISIGVWKMFYWYDLLMYLLTGRTREFPRERREERRRREYCKEKLMSFNIWYLDLYCILICYCCVFVFYRADPFSKKDWYDIKAPSVFSVKNVGKTLVTRTQGTKVCVYTFDFMNTSLFFVVLKIMVCFNALLLGCIRKLYC
jgi:hypothetical protein